MKEYLSYKYLLIADSIVFGGFKLRFSIHTPVVSHHVETTGVNNGSTKNRGAIREPYILLLLSSSCLCHRDGR